MIDQRPILPDSAREGMGIHRHPLSGSSLVLVLFVLAALPPASLAQGFQHQAVLELLGSAQEAPRREAPRELRAFKGWVNVLATNARPWVGGAAAGAAVMRSSAFDLRPRDLARAFGGVEIPETERAHVRAALHDLPPPRR